MENDVWSIFFSGEKTLRFQKGAGEAAGSAGFVRILNISRRFWGLGGFGIACLLFFNYKGHKSF